MSLDIWCIAHVDMKIIGLHAWLIGDARKDIHSHFNWKYQLVKMIFQYIGKGNSFTTVTKNGIKLGNWSVSPHNIDLIAKYDCFINIEKTNRDKYTKYLYKYMHKGTNRSTIVIIGSSGQVDKTKQYLYCRYIFASKAYWRIFGCDILNTTHLWSGCHFTL